MCHCHLVQLRINRSTLSTDIESDRIDSGGFWLMNVDNGQQTVGGEDALAIGDMANTIPCEEPPQWQLKELSSGSAAIEVASDGRGAGGDLFRGRDPNARSVTARTAKVPSSSRFGCPDSISRTVLSKAAC